MKKMKKLVSLLLAAVMVIAMAATVFAANVSIEGDTNSLLTNHSFKAYQIFSGDMSDGKLTNIQWGNGVDSVSFLTALKNMQNTKFGACNSAEEVADVLSANNTDDALAKEVAKLALANKSDNGTSLTVGSENSLSEGYYLIVDTTNVSDQDAVANAALLQVVGEVTIHVKTDKPTLDKDIKHNETDTWGKVGDNQIGDTVEFRTITTVPDTTYYDTYTYKITDTMSAGLTSNVETKSDLTIKINDTDTKLAETYYSVTVNGNHFELEIDIKAAVAANVMEAGDSLYTYYTGVLNEGAIIYDVGKQDNKAQLEYSNSPDGTGTGKTDEKKVYDWTYKMGVNKVDENGNALIGAKFVLSKDGSLTDATLSVNEETGVPANTDNLIALIKGEGGVYTVAPSDYTGNTVYVIDDQAATIKGLDDATDYYLYETKAPDGYNKLTAPVKFKITTDYKEDGSAVADGKPTVTVGTQEASTTLSTNVKNKQGSSLPETGGIGTTIFYVLGAILVIGAGVLLITKKRMSVQK